MYPAGGVGNFEFIAETKNLFTYLNILKYKLRQCVEKLGLDNEYYFQQYNDLKHTDEIVRFWLPYIIPKQLLTAPQPADLNPRAYLWALLEWNVRKY